ncbi:hypothetical protein PPTG_12250 [Phytophthora nicotianae INRA-310]|uniref:Uncharacterized protein n=1 Tax=Phytophthora nicotianae (strain INRA-310) TaxID=761204 RepID=W2Q6I0_PHYN3|nr:hypothetical protein PPTG_12250 [Phytophthora nicotianae INRA-310]ETN08471.1 hypothetical protein PPTG_12250 [Phytophthora nicotianae INRA-310]
MRATSQDNDYVWSYLQKIHHTDWSVVGDIQPTEEESKWLGQFWKNTSSHGQPIPLFGVRTTS